MDLSLKEAAELFAKWGGATLGALYLFGLLIANVHLARLGITDFNILRIRSLLTGGIAVTPVLFAAAALFPLRSQFIGDAPAQRLWSLRMARGIFVWLLFVVLVLTYWHQGLTGNSHLLDTLIIAVSVCSYYLYLTFARLAKTLGHWHKVVASGTLGLTAYTGLFLTHIYPQTPAYLGGARPERAKLVVDAQGVAAVNAMGIRVQPGNGITDPVFIFYENDELFVVSPRDVGSSSTLQLPKRLVIGRISCPESTSKDVPPLCVLRFFHNSNWQSQSAKLAIPNSEQKLVK